MNNFFLNDSNHNNCNNILAVMHLSDLVLENVYIEVGSCLVLLSLVLQMLHQIAHVEFKHQTVATALGFHPGNIII